MGLCGAYDNDGDGYTEPIVLIHAGPEGFLTGDPWDIWGHSWVLGSMRNYDGVWISRYTITAEYWDTIEPGWSDMTIGYTLTVAPDAQYAWRYVNAWFDWNRDGDWGDVLTCTGGITTSEWAAPNAVVSRGSGAYYQNLPPECPRFQTWG